MGGSRRPVRRLTLDARRCAGWAAHVDPFAGSLSTLAAVLDGRLTSTRSQAHSRRSPPNIISSQLGTDARPRAFFAGFLPDPSSSSADSDSDWGSDRATGVASSSPATPGVSSDCLLYTSPSPRDG